MDNQPLPPPTAEQMAALRELMRRYAGDPLALFALWVVAPEPFTALLHEIAAAAVAAVAAPSAQEDRRG